MTVQQSARMLPLDDLIAHESNVRDNLFGIEDLARSILAHGIIEPLVVTEHPDVAGKWLILAGHRRRAAAAAAHLDTVPCVIRHGEHDETSQRALMLVENMQRHDLNPMEKAEAIGELLAAGNSQSDVARLVGIHPSTVNYYASLLELDEESREEVRAGNVAVRDAREQIVADRQARRQAEGTPERGRPVHTEPAWFSHRHQLAPEVRATCGHSTRPKVGQQGCGQCWELVIRADQARTPDPVEAAEVALHVLPGQTRIDDALAETS